MKKVIGLALAIILMSSLLVGCAEEIIGDYIDQYTPPVEKEKLKLNLYVICEEGTTKNACDTVQQRIESYTLSTYDTAVKVHYFTADEYVAYSGTHCDHLVIPEPYKTKLFEGLRDAVIAAGNKIVFSDTYILYLAKKPY